MCGFVRVSPWWRRKYELPKRRPTFTRVHCAIAQKVVTAILTAVTIWNLSKLCELLALPSFHHQATPAWLWMYTLYANGIKSLVHTRKESLRIPGNTPELVPWLMRFPEANPSWLQQRYSYPGGFTVLWFGITAWHRLCAGTFTPSVRPARLRQPITLKRNWARVKSATQN
jgi:hypothetical protein